MTVTVAVFDSSITLISFRRGITVAVTVVTALFRIIPRRPPFTAATCC